MRIQTINVRLPKEIVLWLDTLVKKGIYKSRSEAVRDYARDYTKGKGAENE
ncbi:MAG: ribbon-helix-helix domain-containing protein [Candidatus Woesearchaeota archaeon]